MTYLPYENAWFIAWFIGIYVFSQMTSQHFSTSLHNIVIFPAHMKRLEGALSGNAEGAVRDIKENTN